GIHQSRSSCLIYVIKFVQVISCNLPFKDYVYKSRSLIIARFIRIIQHSDQDAINVLVNSISTLFKTEGSKTKSKSKKKERKNSVDELLIRFGRK
ncbi:hypothetical protein NJT07_10045, partial [Limosilactobacillus fermentum]|nr:hypothetical protein [Limosilactobacillus fermentum]